jgi:hypothetical protein
VTPFFKNLLRSCHCGPETAHRLPCR